MESIALILVFLALILTGPIMAMIFDKKQDESNRMLISFIAENFEALSGGATLDYNGAAIDLRTPIVRYRYCYSVIAMTTGKASGMYLGSALDSEEAKNAKLTCQLITAFSGWWGIPWGIIRSIQYLYSNGVNNGISNETVGDVMYRIAQAAQNAQESRV